MAEKIVKDSQGLVKELVNDCISRKAAIEKLISNLTYMHTFGADRSIDLIEELPSAQPERKRGKWIEDDDGWDGVIWRCSECDALFTLVDGTPEENEYYFCPHCGADMREDNNETD